MLLVNKAPPGSDFDIVQSFPAINGRLEFWIDYLDIAIVKESLKFLILIELKIKLAIL